LGSSFAAGVHTFVSPSVYYEEMCLKLTVPLHHLEFRIELREAGPCLPSEKTCTDQCEKFKQSSIVYRHQARLFLKKEFFFCLKERVLESLILSIALRRWCFQASFTVVTAEPLKKDPFCVISRPQGKNPMERLVQFKQVTPMVF